MAFAVDDDAAARNLTSDFWDNESWQPSNYPATRFLLDLADPLLTLLPFSRRRSPVDAAAPVAAQVKGITNVVRVLGGWGTSSWCGPKNGAAWSPQQTLPCDAYDLAFRDNRTHAIKYAAFLSLLC